MHREPIPILLTSSVVAHDKGVRLKDTGERTRLAIESIQQWRSIAPSHPLVLCDGSGYDFQLLVSAINGAAPIECLYFKNDIDAVHRQGRGFGEGEIVQYALDNSTLIQSAGCFAKCTSKLWVENFDACIKQWSGLLLLKGVFDDVFSPLANTKLAYIDTRFYVMQVNLYRNLFANAHRLIRLEDGYGLEESFRDIFLKSKQKHCLLSPPPVICGVGGGTAAYYKNTPLRKLKEMLRYQLCKRNPSLKPWFTGLHNEIDG